MFSETLVFEDSGTWRIVAYNTRGFVSDSGASNHTSRKGDKENLASVREFRTVGKGKLACAITNSQSPTVHILLIHARVQMRTVVKQHVSVIVVIAVAMLPVIP
jgi:hypothetical protein